ncbi:MAG TPA: folylpolyglutamate synthase/dihydrofolate synthase family protein [Thermoplasmata archaeon]|nr:folylpolyglutamate synthase/dihydrofolate synthase family protein [Thermoplasmata archaeon]
MALNEGSGTPRATPEDPRAYRATLDSLFARRRFGIRPGLQVVTAILAAHGDPQRRFPALHITGSKGKGSTAALAESVLRAHALKTGLFTSPHLSSFRDRIQVDRTPIPPPAVVAGVARIDATSRRLESEGAIDRPPTFFEVTTVLAFDWFAEQAVEAAVVEVGMGGRLDSTNVLASRVGVITTIELEHTELLGPDVGTIAREKSGIFHTGMTGVVGPLPPAAAAVAESEADRAGVPLWHLGREVRYDHRALSEAGQQVDLHFPGRTLEGVAVPLWGTFQADNLACAVAASARFLSSLGRELSPEATKRGLAKVRWPGRLERVGRRPDLYYDVAHTPASARALAESLGELLPLADPDENAIVFGCLRGKDVARILDALSPLARTLVIVPVRSERSLSSTEIRVEAAGRFPRIVAARSAEEGVRMGRAATGPDGFTLVVGSDYLIGELLRPDGGIEPDLSDPGTEPPPARRRGVA